ncbi:MAG: 16S rRNA (guanine(966)-N(2))-methyltransferase RsmD [Thermodesulfobacteriota bacterium]
MQGRPAKKIKNMRLTGGIKKGCRLAGVKELAIRPTSDRVRSSIFNILGQALNGCSTLDLFAGTGSLGLESLSRGSKRAVFIDASAKAVALVKKNVALCGYAELAAVAKVRLPDGLSRVHSLSWNKFDLVFLDPPYGKGYITPTLSRLVDEQLLSRDSRVVVESSTRDDDALPAKVGDLVLNIARTYGSTKIGVYLY